MARDDARGSMTSSSRSLMTRQAGHRLGLAPRLGGRVALARRAVIVACAAHHRALGSWPGLAELLAFLGGHDIAPGLARCAVGECWGDGALELRTCALTDDGWAELEAMTTKEAA